MSDEKPFAVPVGTRSLRIEDWTFEAGSGNDMAASSINSAVAARERKAAARALREAATQFGAKSRTAKWINARAAALEGGAL